MLIVFPVKSKRSLKLQVTRTERIEPRSASDCLLHSRRAFASGLTWNISARERPTPAKLYFAEQKILPEAWVIR